MLEHNNKFAFLIKHYQCFIVNQLIYFSYKQNPENCEVANRLTCKPQQSTCGFGCQTHWMLYCFMISYGSGRTFVPHSSFLQTYDKQGWHSVFLPLSETCQHLNSTKHG